MSANPITYFLRAWNLAVTTQTGDKYQISNSLDAESLRVVFTVDTYMLMAYWQAEIKIFNLSATTASQLQQGTNTTTPGAGGNSPTWQFLQPLNLGDSVSLSAGYQYTGTGAFTPNGNVIYNGKILQSTWMRENIVDWVLTLRCSTNLLQDALNKTNLSIAPNTKYIDTLHRILDQANIPIESIDDASNQALSNASDPGSQALYGRPFDLIAEIASQNDLMCWVSDKGLNLRYFPTTNATPQYAYGPPNLGGPFTTGQYSIPVKQTLIGVPEQTQLGVMFKVLMDSAVKIGDIFQLVPGTIINAVPLQIGQLPPIPNQSGIYAVIGVRHVGDSRGHGEDWYTEINAVSLNFFAYQRAARSPIGIIGNLAGIALSHG